MHIDKKLECAEIQAAFAGKCLLQCGKFRGYAEKRHTLLCVLWILRKWIDILYTGRYNTDRINEGKCRKFNREKWIANIHFDMQEDAGT